MNLKDKIAILLIAISTGPGPALAQVYRCEADGKINYSDAPCLGAKRIDVTPTQGMDKLSGTSRKGADVRRDEHQRAMSNALRPLLGETPEQYKTRHRRAANHLTQNEQAKCNTLDRRLQNLEEAERNATGQQLEDAQKQLLQDRKQYRSLKC